jgi:hypothetical protein
MYDEFFPRYVVGKHRDIPRCTEFRHQIALRDIIKGKHKTQVDDCQLIQRTVHHKNQITGKKAYYSGRR